MTILEFIVGVITPLAWPIAIVVIVILLKKELGQLMARIYKIRHNGSEIILQKEIEQAVMQADENNLPQIERREENDKVYKFAKVSPRGAIIESWLEVEEAVISYCNRKGIICDAKSPALLIRSIQSHNLDNRSIGDGVLNMLDKLRQMRNDAVHLRESEITKESAVQYSYIAKRVILRLEEA